MSGAPAGCWYCHEMRLRIRAGPSFRVTDHSTEAHPGQPRALASPPGGVLSRPPTTAPAPRFHMFDALSKGFRAAKNRLSGVTELTEDNVDQALRDVRLS